MVNKIDPEVLSGFIAEVRGYIPTIRAGIDSLEAGPRSDEVLEVAYRHAHCIRGASAMVGLASLSAVAGHLEAALEDIALGKLPVTGPSLTLFRDTVGWFELYLEGVQHGAPEDPTLAEEIAGAYLGLRAALADTEDEIPGIGEIPPEEPADEPHRVQAAAPGVTPDEVPPELLEVFQLEAEEHLRNISTLLPQLREQPGNRDLVQGIRRSAHTLKGAAAMVGFGNITQLTHRMEDLLDLLYDGAMSVTPEIVQLLFNSQDALEDMAAGRFQEPVLAELYARYGTLLGAGQLQEAAAAEEAEQAPAAPAEEAAPAAGRAAGQTVRVPLQRLDDVIKLVSELVIARSAFEQRLAAYARQVQEFQLSAGRLRRIASRLESDYEVSALARGSETALVGAGAGIRSFSESTTTTHDFDELEFDRYTEFHLLSRELAESTTDMMTVANELEALAGDFDGYLNRQVRLTGEIQDKLMRTRMVPVASVEARLQRTVRNAAEQLRKRVELVLEGEETELDKTVLEEMTDPLMHLLRNAADHGIESAERRRACGKPAHGTIRLRAFQEGTQVVLQVSDDGGGIDLEGLRAAAARGGHVADASALSDDELRELLFRPGFSTARSVSEISGRGVGLDVVKSHVYGLKGTLTLASEKGLGTTFTIRLPLTLAVLRALMVKAHNQTFAIPLAGVRQILRLDNQEPERIGRELVVRLGNKVYPLIPLGQALGLKQPAENTTRGHPLLILDAGGREIALVVDHLLGGREIVQKNLGSHVRRLRGIAGATLTGDGNVVPIVNPAELTVDPARLSAPVRVTPARMPETITVLIVDDSPSVRRVVSTRIQSAGWQAVTAKDGVDALEVLARAAAPPDLVLLDIEMPRMDGYELLSTLRAQEAYRTLPVLMVTSRSGAKHKNKAMEMGASGYLVKPYQDEVLLGRIRDLVRAARGV